MSLWLTSSHGTRLSPGWPIHILLHPWRSSHPALCSPAPFTEPRASRRQEISWGLSQLVGHCCARRKALKSCYSKCHFPDQRHCCHLQWVRKAESQAHPDLLLQNLHFNKLPVWGCAWEMWLQIIQKSLLEALSGAGALQRILFPSILIWMTLSQVV